MRYRSLIAIIALLAGFFVLSACGPKPDPAGESSLFVVNGHAGDSELSLSAEGQVHQFEVYSEEDWEVREEGLPADWLILEKVKNKRKDHVWDLSITLSENESDSPRTAVFLFTSGQLVRKVSLIQAVEDPILRNHVVGAYGVPGGDFIFDREHFQFGRLYYGEDCLTCRFLDPRGVRVVTLSGLVRQPQVGMSLTVLYRVMEQGFTRVCESYDVQVIRIRENLMWLKKDERIYFVVKL